MQVPAGKVALFALKLYNGKNLIHMGGLHICCALFDRQLWWNWDCTNQKTTGTIVYLF